MFRDNGFVQENSGIYVNKHPIRIYSLVYISTAETPWCIRPVFMSGIPIFCVMPQLPLFGVKDIISRMSPAALKTKRDIFGVKGTVKIARVLFVENKWLKVDELTICSCKQHSRWRFFSSLLRRISLSAVTSTKAVLFSCLILDWPLLFLQLKIVCVS